MRFHDDVFFLGEFDVDHQLSGHGQPRLYACSVAALVMLAATPVGNGKYDQGALDASAMELLRRGRPADALKIFYHLAETDLSLDGGYLGWRIGQCYEALGDIHAARYWHVRAVEQNPAIRTLSADALERIGRPALDELLIALPDSRRSYG